MTARAYWWWLIVAASVGFWGDELFRHVEHRVMNAPPIHHGRFHR